MRNVLAFLTEPSAHFGQAYDMLAPAPKSDGKYDPDERDTWLDRCTQIAISSDYALFFTLWKDSFALAHVEEVTLKSRLLVGHGNPSGSEVGLTVHRTWGVPMIPGSALKGLTANYTQAVYGAMDDAWRGPICDDRRIVAPAGDNYRYLFGSADVDRHEGQERQGEVVFHDALYVPGAVVDDKPFVRDVLTVHQKNYYDHSGQDWPSDWDKPNPVGFITVRPGAKFLLAVSGPDGWRELAMRLLQEALEDWGAGGKTSLGYGRVSSS